MKKLISYSILLLVLAFVNSSCSMCNHLHRKEQKNQVLVPGPQAIIYRTKADYSNLVPVILTSDRKSIQSYPDRTDLIINGKQTVPTPLHKGFLLDNRGISENVAFISLSYEQYAALPATPTPEELMNMLVDKKPLKEMYSCGLRSKFGNITEELNAVIDSGDLTRFKRMK